MEDLLRVYEPPYIGTPPTVTAESPAPPATPAATPLPPLPDLPASDVLFLRPNDSQYKTFLPAANTRTQLSPALRAVCKTEHAVAAMVDWVKTNNVSFAVRGGGHSYEGFSQSADVVIDLRGMAAITVDTATNIVTVGSGATLRAIYHAVADHGLALQAGSCGTVGISGHVLGGGHGLLARSHGLTCDGLDQVTLVDSQAQVRVANATSEPDLFWACKGGGGGSFGIATEFKLRAFSLTTTLVFGVGWTLSNSAAAKLFAAWQSWAPYAPSNITSIMTVTSGGSADKVRLRCIGQSVGSERELRAQLKPLVNMVAPSQKLLIKSLRFIDAANHFSGKDDPVYMKAKSDYVLAPLSADAIKVMMDKTAKVSGVSLLCDAYGGRIADVAAADTAFPRRTGTQFCIQYYSSWKNPVDTASLVTKPAKIYDAMRRFMFGASYVNYCDLDLGAGYAHAYWGNNLPRLMSVKARYDPDNLFRHAQSVPLPP